MQIRSNVIVEKKEKGSNLFWQAKVKYFVSQCLETIRSCSNK